MAKPRRGIKFNHRNANGHSSSADGRRSSFSDISEAASEPGSPTKAGDKADVRSFEFCANCDIAANRCLKIAAARSFRVREEEADLHYQIDMDFRYDRRVLCSHVHGPYLYHWDCDGSANSVVQGGYCDRECSESSEAIAVYKGAELVLAGYDDVLPVRRERHLLLQAHCAGRQGLAAICDTSSVHQLHALCYR